MKITRRDLGVLMIIAGIIIAFLGYKMSFQPNQEEIEQIQNEEAQLKKDIAELQPIKEDAPKYEKLIKQYQQDLEDIMKEFPADVWQEDNIMYVVELLDNEDLHLDIPGFAANPATVTNTVQGAGSFAEKVYTLLRASLSFGYTVDEYADAKAFIDYIYSDKEHKRTLDNISLMFDKETGEISGTTNITQYVITDGSKQYAEQELPDDNLGIESGCIFGETEESEEK